MNRRRNRGMTMVEIVIAFVMLTLVMGIMYSCIQFASNLMREAADIDRNNAAYQKNVADTFVSSGSYAGGAGEKMMLSFQKVKEDGSIDPASDIIKFELYKQNVAVDKTAGSGGEKRNLYLYSTGPAGGGG